ncbi:MAG TPA: T9SS type A sorting domain-containing protein [Bacteroidia bacterium]
MKRSLLFSFSLFCLSASAQWMQQASGFSTPDMEVNSISVVNSNVVWAAAYDSTFSNISGYFTRTTNGGTTWSASIIPNSTGSYISCIYGADQNNAWVTLDDLNNGGGGIYHTADGGVTWNQQTPSAFSGAYGYGDLIYFWNANEGLAVGDSNGGYWEFYTTSNGGTTWTRVPQGNIPANLNGEWGQDGVFSVSGNTIWFATNAGRVYKSIDKGLNWTVSQSGLSQVLMIAFKDANTGLISDATGLALQKTTDGGTTWTNVAFNGLLYDYGMCFAPGSPGVFVTTGYGGSSFSADDGLNWTPLDSLDHTVVQFQNLSTGYSGGWNANVTTGGMYKWNGSLGVNELAGNSVKIFPNPSTDHFTIQLKNDVRDAELILTDISGREVARLENVNGRNIPVNNGDLAPGIYLFTVKGKNGSVVNGKMEVQ